jgi:hypothetical protein
MKQNNGTLLSFVGNLLSSSLDSLYIGLTYTSNLSLIKIGTRFILGDLFPKV